MLKYFREWKKSSNFATVIETTQSFLYLKTD